jgi:hypothetical protein
MLIEPSIKQTNIFEENKPKEQYFKDLIVKWQTEKKSIYFNYGIKYIIFVLSEILDGVYIGELAKEEIYTKPVEGETSITETQDLRTPFVYLIVDINKQILLIQDKTTVFQDIELTKTKIESFLTENLSKNSISVYLEPITDKKDFWQELAELGDIAITDLDLTLNAPNLFRGRFAANEFVREIYEELNITEVTLKFKNRIGKLKVMSQNLGDYVALASSGGGKYLLKGIKNGRRVAVKSIDFIRKKIYDEDRIEEIDKNKLSSDLEDLDKLNDEEI